jgi:hypothetical protein
LTPPVEASHRLEPNQKVVESDESFVIPCAAPESSTGGAEMWKPEHRRAAERRGLRDPSDLTDAEWTLVEQYGLLRPAAIPRHRANWLAHFGA